MSSRAGDGALKVWEGPIGDSDVTAALVRDDDDVRWTHYDRYVPKPVGGFDALIDHCAGDDAAARFLPCLFFYVARA